MGDPEKKRLKAKAKKAKKLAKAELKAARPGSESATPQQAAAPGQQPSPGVRFAELVRGILYVVLGASLVIALILGQQGAIVSLDDIVDSLFAARAGKIILVLIALALVIYGLKHLRIVR